METFFTCGVDGCVYVEDVPDPHDIRKYYNAKHHMVSHYRWEHADMVGTKVYSDPGNPTYWRYDYRPIPDATGPSLHYGDDVSTWSELCEIEGRA